MRTKHSAKVNLGQLRELADLWGIEVQYHDVTGERREARPESLLALLSVLGAPVSRYADVPSGLRERRAADWQRGMEPVHVAWGGRLPSIPLRLPRTRASGLIECQTHLEDGDHLSWSVHLEALPDEDAVEIDGIDYLLKSLPVSAQLPLGYHRFSAELQGRRYETTLVAAPVRAYSPRGQGWKRSCGVFLPLYALHSRQSWGAGNFADLRSLRRWADELGIDFVGTLPLLAAFLDQPFEISPYSPVSRLFWNEFYLHIEDIPELSTSPAAGQLVDSATFQQSIAALRAKDMADYREEYRLKRIVLEELARSLFASSSERRAALESYVAQHAYLDDYAVFRSLCERFRGPWQTWPDPLRDGRYRATDYDENVRRYHCYAQWLCDAQLGAEQQKSAGAGLYLDLPLGVNADGYDVWRHRSAFAIGAAGGCPPDLMFPKGQNWGFVPLHPEGIREQGYRYVRDYLQHQLPLAKVLRIDHMPSFHRLFWIPPGMDASQGAYVRYRAEELYAVFCLQSHRHQTMLVGEDLGTVPSEVPEAMARHNIHRMFVVQYELKPDPTAALPDPPAASIASVNTHDMSPFAGFWQSREIDERLECGLITMEQREDQDHTRGELRSALLEFLSSETGMTPDLTAHEALRACLAHLSDGPARMVVVNLEDLWGETHSQNVPSTCDESPNWRRKARLSFEEFSQDPDVLKMLVLLRAAISGPTP